MTSTSQPSTSPLAVPGLSGLTDLRLCPNMVHFSEFQGGYHGTCGETALATAMVAATPPIESQQEAINLMLSLTKEMIALKWASASGSTPMSRLHDEAVVKRHFTVDASTYISYKEPLDATELHNLLKSTAGVKPIVLEVARAGNLPGDGKTVQYHFICVLGVSHQGYICNDGDNSAINQHLVLYTWDQIVAARPCGQLVIELQHLPVKPAPTPAPVPVTTPAPTPTPTPVPVVSSTPAPMVGVVPQSKYDALVAAIKKLLNELSALLS